MEKRKRLISFSATSPKGILCQPFNSYLFKTNVTLLQMVALTTVGGSSKLFVQMTASHLSNRSDIYILWESRHSWFIHEALNHR